MRYDEKSKMFIKGEWKANIRPQFFNPQRKLNSIEIDLKWSNNKSKTNEWL